MYFLGHLVPFLSSTYCTIVHRLSPREMITEGKWSPGSLYSQGLLSSDCWSRALCRHVHLHRKMTLVSGHRLTLSAHAPPQNFFIVLIIYGALILWGLRTSY